MALSVEIVTIERTLLTEDGVAWERDA